MKNVIVNLNEIKKVNWFVQEVTSFESDIDLVSGRYVINAKSIMGIFSLDLSKPIEVVIDSDNEAEINRFVEVMKKYKTD